jgi:hypothetical protein
LKPTATGGSQLCVEADDVVGAEVTEWEPADVRECFVPTVVGGAIHARISFP